MYIYDVATLMRLSHMVQNRELYILSSMSKYKPIDIELGDKTRTLRFDLNALRGLHLQGYDPSMFGKLVEGGSVNFDVLLITLWAFLLSDADDKGETDFTPNVVGKWIDLTDLPYCIGKLNELFASAGKADAPPDETASPLALTSIQ